MTAAGVDRVESAAAIARDGTATRPTSQRARSSSFSCKLESVVANQQKLRETGARLRAASKSAATSSHGEFIERYVRGSRPLVLTDVARDWPAMKRWSPQDLKSRFGHLEVEIQAERNADPDVRAEQARPPAPASALADFVDQVLAGGPTNDYYLTANNEALRRPEFAPLLADIGTPADDLQPGRAVAARLVLVRPGRHRHAAAPRHDHAVPHADRRPQALALHLAAGHAPPVQLLRRLQPDRPRRARPGPLPAFQRRASVLEVVVEPGETVFLPLGWWHQVTSLDVSLSFSFRTCPSPNHYKFRTGRSATGSRLAGDTFLRWLAPAPRRRWVDVGCGNGAFTEMLLARCAPLEVQGIDPSPEQLAFAREPPGLRAPAGSASAMRWPCPTPTPRSTRR